MLVSVIIATYCGEKFLEDQLQSLLQQSYKPDEVIISDDGSGDSTIDIAKNFIQKNNLENKWHIYINKKNKGYAKNFLEAALKAKGKFILFCDQDDLWEEDKIEITIKEMKKNQDIKVLASNLKPFTFEENTRKWDKKSLESMAINDGSIKRILFNEENFHLKRSGCTMCITKEFLHSIMPYWIEKWAHDDFVWKLSLANNGLGILQKITVNRRMHENNATVVRQRSQEWRINQLNDLKDQEKSYLKYIKENEISNKMEKIEIIEKNIKSLDLRIDLINKKKIWNWIILFSNYKKCYPRIKGLYLDLFLTFRKVYKGV